MDAEAAVRAVIDRFDAANEQMIAGDCGLWTELMSHGPDVTLLGAYGGHVTGWDEVSLRFRRTADGYGAAGQGGSSSRVPVAAWIGADVSSVVDVERHEMHAEDGTSITFFYRTTHVLRREEDGWRVVLRHADPLATFRGPQYAHVDAQIGPPLNGGVRTRTPEKQSRAD